MLSAFNGLKTDQERFNYENSKNSQKTCKPTEANYLQWRQGRL